MTRTLTRDLVAWCPEFEICTHESCRSSCASWSIADAALEDGKKLKAHIPKVRLC